jgi:hypothetical protein
MPDCEATARVTVRSEAREVMRTCQLDIDGYSARNGYLHGASNYFDLEPGATQIVGLNMEVMRRVPGTHTFRVHLECGHRVKDGTRASLQVSE